MEQVTPAAPAQTTPTPAPTVSASMDAAARGDFAAFEAAQSADRKGAPLARVEVVPETPKVETETPAAPVQAAPVSKRQQDLNERIRTSVERATAEAQAEITRLRALVQAQPPTPQPVQAPQPPVAQTPDWKRYRAMPDAPKLAEFDGPDALEDHAAAMSVFVLEKREQERQVSSTQSAHEQAEQTQIRSFDARVDEAAKADPEIVAKILPIARDLSQRGGVHYIVSQLALASPVGPLALRHFAEHPDALARLTDVPDALRTLPQALLIREHVAHVTKEFGKLEARLEQATPAPVAAAPVSPISAAPPPPPVITTAGSSTDPKKAALERGDFATFDSLDMAERVARRRSA